MVPVKPNFFIVGKPKCGTTSLHAMLHQHPDIYMSPVKEPHHFHRHYMEVTARRGRGYRGLPYRDHEAYLELFQDAKTQRIVGESSTGYLYSREAAREIARFDPDAKILMVFREPVDFTYALHGQLLRSGNEDQPDFREALRLEESRKQGRNIPATTSYPDYLFYTEQAKYAEQAERFLAAFDRSRVKVLIYEDFRKHNLAAYREILEFLDVDPGFTPELVELQAHRRVRFVKLAGWLTYHGVKKKGAVAQWAPGWLLAAALPALSRLFYKDDPRPPLDYALRKELEARFRPEVVRLGELTGLDLVTKWRYGRLADAGHLEAGGVPDTGTNEAELIGP